MTDFMIYSDQMNMYDVLFHDPDKSIYNGKISVNNGQSSKSYTIDYDEKTGGYCAEISLSDLRIGTEYTVTITADQIRRSSGTSYRYSDVELFSYTFTAGDGINGSLTLQSLSYGLFSDDNSGKVYRKEDFDLYKGGYTSAYLGDNGTPVENGSWYLTDYLPVVGENVYYFDRVRSSDTSEAYVCFYDENKAVLGGGRRYIYNGSYVIAPEGAKYVRYSVADSYQDEFCIYVGGCYQMQMDGAKIVKEAAITIRVSGDLYSRYFR